MTKSLLIILLLLIQGGISHAQKVTVIDQTDLQPIEDVLIISLDNTKTSLTTLFGVADLTTFDRNDTIIFQHPSYEKLILPLRDVTSSRGVIRLKERTIHLSQIVVSANKWEQERSEVPNKITSITSKEIAFDNPQTSADLLANTGEVFIQKSQLGGGSPMIRGFAANSVLLVYDGVRMNNLIYRSGNLQNVINIDPNAIGNSEVIFGPGSVIYGSDALGGVMDFYTKVPQLSYDKEVSVTGNAMARFSTANREKTGHIDLNIGTKKWAFLTSFTFSDFDDLRMGSQNHNDYQRFQYITRINGQDSMVNNSDPNVQKYSGLSQMFLIQNIRFRPNDKWDLTYNFTWSNTSDIPRYDKLLEYKGDNLKYANWYYGPQKWMVNILNVKFLDTTRFFDKMKITGAYQIYEESRHSRTFKEVMMEEQFEHVNVYSLNVDFDKLLNPESHMYYGIELFANTLKSTADQKNINSSELSKFNTRYPDGNNIQFSVAGYASYLNKISQNTTLQAGLRYSFLGLHSTFVDSSYLQFSEEPLDNRNGALNGSIGVAYKPNKTWQINSNISSGFRAPNLDGLAKVFQPSKSTIIVPNYALKPEYAYNIDAGFVKNFSEKVMLDLTFFYTYLNSAMVTRRYTYNGQDQVIFEGDTFNVIAVVNAGYAHIYGGSFNFSAEIGSSLAFKAHLTYTRGRDDLDDPLRHAAPLFGSTHLIYTKKKTRLEIYAIYNGEKSYSDMPITELDKPYMYATDSNGNLYSPRWWTLNFRGSYQVNRFLQVNAGLENILNNRYRPYSSGIVAPGIDFYVTLRARL
jgi:hemoglobin/transferrin/lactoferrin receptor protein